MAKTFEIQAAGMTSLEMQASRNLLAELIGDKAHTLHEWQVIAYLSRFM